MSNGVDEGQDCEVSCTSSSIQFPSNSAKDSVGDLEMAKQWTYYVEALKTTIDCLYEICRQKQSVVGCKEAIMYLSNSVRDFEALIDSINVEILWENKNQPHAVAWEIRKTTTSPPGIAVTDPTKKKESEMLIDALNVSPVVVHEVVRDAENKINAAVQSSLLKNDSVEEKENSKENMYSAKHDSSQDGEWCLVKSRCKGKKGVPGTVKDSLPKKSNDDNASQIKRPAMNVYERLTSGILRPPNPSRSPILSSSLPATRLTCPRSAMDLPQTKASMAKMAYSRQLLWLKHKPLLTEKLEMKRRRDLRKALTNVNQGSSSRVSAINFADPAAVRRSAQAFKQRQLHDCARSLNVSRQALPTTSEEVELANKSNRQPSESVTGCVSSDMDQLSAVQRTGSAALSCPVLPEGMDPDEAWTAMTEEEESLLQEEQSLTKEIEEEESISIDDELERQVAAEASLYDLSSEKEDEKQHLRPPECKKERPTLQDLVNSFKKEMEEYASMSWGEIVEREITHYRKPGDFAQIHEKLLSPSRRRKQDSANRGLEERQQRAEELRQMLQDQKANRLKELSKKVEEVRRKRAEIIERKKQHLQKRMEKAEENRQKSIDEIVKKARDDDVKVMQISFINELEAKNMRHDVMAKNQEWEQRAQLLAEERARKMEEKAAREAAAEERRRNANTERAERLKEKADKKLARHAEIELQKIEQEKERATAAKEKQRQCYERVAEKKAVNTATLKKKIEEKQEVTRRRYEETLAQVKQRASEMSSPRQIEWIASLADFSRFPSESVCPSPCSSPVNGCVKKCRRCNCKVYGALDLMAHLLFGEHLKSKKMKISDVDYEYLKSELEACVIDCSDEESGGKSVLNLEIKKPNASSKKKRTRLRQKLTNQTKEYLIKLDSSSVSVAYNNQTTKTIIDKPVRDVVQAVKNTVDGDIISDCSNGVCRDTFNDKICDSTVTHTVERAIGEIQRTLWFKGYDKKQHLAFLKCVYKEGLLDALLALISFSYIGDALASQKTQMKASGLLSELVSSSELLWARIFYTNRLLIVLDTLSINIKASFSCTASSGVSIYAKIFPTFSFLFLLISQCNQYDTNASFGIIACGGERLCVLLSYLFVIGFGEFCASALSSVQLESPKGNKEKVESIYQLMIAAFSLEFFCVLDGIIPMVDTFDSMRSNRTTFGDGFSSDRNSSTSVFSVMLPLLFRVLVCRLYSSLTVGSSFLETTFYSPSAACEFESLMRKRFSGETVCKYFLKIWIIFVRREAGKAKAFVQDPELSLRVVHILSFLTANFSEQPLCPSPLKKNNIGTTTECLMKDIIFAIGYFASLNEKAQMLCVFGWQKSILMRLCELPLGYFSNRSLMMELFPTLSAICFKNDPAVEQLKRVLSPTMLITFLKETKFEEIPENERFPLKLWQDAIDYFNNC